MQSCFRLQNKKIIKMQKQMKKSKLLQFGSIFLALLLFAASGISQRKVTGVVEDARTNSQLAGATITLKGSKTNALSKEDGTFDIKVPNGKVSLVVTFVGYESKTISVPGNETKIIVSLTESTNQLSDVVIVGMQAQTKRMSTSAISTVLSKDIENLPAPSVDHFLHRKI